ncbi:maleylpyruvate isomerase N-terminal domain-containing protein [Mucilaginibacter flavidus]|uniref:maleylpyruvate isomerase N-terminal domain-containing protein n=1 Tax=Mucilaginibacter flavidus TaxID=2949309 RepID=UPI0020929540|nr:maleylpyruvate isomerase N-terminal domain-containing protein [Mucilaginibacter flavidus]MCO5950258.1 maleylpyruvate isomerase N-terminal domain-containing protein [Mucilaginibacter flavidus]
MDKPIPILTLHLFPVLDKLLIELLRSLEPADWVRPTICPLWNVKDIAAHLLDANMRTISGSHSHFGEASENINSYNVLLITLTNSMLFG